MIVVLVRRVSLVGSDRCQVCRKLGLLLLVLVEQRNLTRVVVEVEVEALLTLAEVSTL